MIRSLSNTITRWREGKISPKSHCPLCHLMIRYGSDKKDPDPTMTGHNYTKLYFDAFRAIRKKPLNIFELGLGTTNPAIPSNMGTNGKPGASLRAWRHFFPNSQIFGADVDKNILFTEDRITTLYCDQTDPVSIAQLWSQPTLSNTLFDIIIEDGLHEYTANLCFLVNSLHKLAPGGMYFAEDLPYDAPTQLLEQRTALSTQFNLSFFDVVQTNKSPLLAIQRL